MKRPSPTALLCVYWLVALFTFGHVLAKFESKHTDAAERIDVGAVILASATIAAAWPLYWSYRFSVALK